MDLTGSTIKPTESRLVLKLVEEPDEEASPPSSSSPMEAQGNDDFELATVVAIGPKVTGMKKGDVVLVSSWAVGSMIGPQTFICDSYAVAAVVAD